jgi:predicted amidohydrolase YtcJ
MSSYADLILTGATVRTPASEPPSVSAVAVRDGRIVGLGDEHGLDELNGPRTEVLKLRPGRVVLPGFQDAHCHPPQSGRVRLRVNLEDAHDLDDYRRIISAYAAAHPDDPWIVGGGW